MSWWNFRITIFLALVLAMCAGELLATAFSGALSAQFLVRLACLIVASVVPMALIESQVRRGMLRFGALNDLARRLSHPIEIQSILDAGLNHAIRLVEADAGCLRLFNEGDLVIATSQDVQPQYLHDYNRISANRDDLQRILHDGEPAVFSVDSLTVDLTDLLADPREKNVVLVPLVSKGNIFGLITLVCRHTVRFIHNDLETLRAIGTSVGIAMANDRAYEGLLRESRTDALTGLGSRRHFEDLYRRELSRHKRSHRPITLAMIDVDNFKHINDHWGHVTGDRVLQAIGQLLQGLRGGDVVARFGGDEFIIMMTETTEDQGRTVVQRVRERLAKLNDERQFPFTVQLSIGLRQLSSPDADLVADADAAMYADKHQHKAQRAPEPLALTVLQPALGD